MRVCKLIAIVGLVMVVTGTTWAVTVPALPVLGDVYPPGSDLHAVHFYTRNRDQSTGYLTTVDGTYTATSPTAAFTGPGVLTELKDPDGKFMTRSGAGGVQSAALGQEDTWGIFSMRILEAGRTTSPGTAFADIFKKLGGDLTYEWTDTNNITGNTVLVGVFFNGWDSEVVTSGTSLQVQTVGTRFELWAVDKSLVNLEGASQGPHYDANFRTAQNRYKTWVDGGGTLLLDGNATYERFIGTQLSSAPLVFDGQTVVYVDIPTSGAGLWDANVGGSAYFTDPLGNKADLKLTNDIDPGADGWSVNSHDDGGFMFNEAIPEPLTMLGVLLGVGGVGKYIRRRFRAA